MKAVGLDRTRGAWVYVVLEAGRFVSGGTVSSAGELDLDSVDAVGIDIPLGLVTDGSQRRAEVEGRLLLGARHSTMFRTWPAWVYESEYTVELRAEARRRCGAAPSRQSWNLREAIFDAARVGDGRWFETHPELAFLRRAGRVLAPKKTWNGVRARLEILARAGLAIPELAGVECPPHDVLDAAVCALVAYDVVRARASHLPEVPEPGEALIWY